MGDLRSPNNEVVKDQILEIPTLAIPSAPPLDTTDSNPHLNNAQGQPPKSVKLETSFSCSQKDEKFSAWDDRATEILIVNRLAMNEKFERAQNLQEQDELWNEILNHLLAAGYSFGRTDLMQYWEFEFYIYKSNINSISAGVQSDSNWKYFELMDNVFKYSVEALKSPKEVREGLLSQPTDSGMYNGVQCEPVITSQPKQVLIPAKNKVVVTAQPRSTAYTSTVPSNRYDGNDEDSCRCCCCCCFEDCSDDYPANEYSRRRTEYTTRTDGPFGISSNTVDFTDDYSDGYTKNYTEVHRFVNNHYTNGDKIGDITSDNKCGEKNREYTRNIGGNINDTSGDDTDYGCDTDSGGYDTGGGYAHYGGYDTGGGEGGDGGCDDGGGDDGGGDDGGGGDD